MSTRRFWGRIFAVGFVLLATASCLVDTGGYSFSDETRCGNRFTDLSSDPSNCGRCGAYCGDGEDCAGGTCTCNEGKERCGLACVNTQTDPENCGRCDVRCTSEQSCRAGACVCNRQGLTACDRGCADITSDEANCGACGKKCPENGICENGTCKCPSTLPDLCGNVCTDVKTDPNHCGSCANDCDFGNTNAKCNAGACSVTGCYPGYVDCNGDFAKGAAGNGCETNIWNDDNNCGGCNIRCPSTKTCSNKQCVGDVGCSGACNDDSDCASTSTYCANLTSGRKCAPKSCQTCFQQNRTCSWSIDIFGTCSDVSCK